MSCVVVSMTVDGGGERGVVSGRRVRIVVRLMGVHGCGRRRIGLVAFYLVELGVEVRGGLWSVV